MEIRDRLFIDNQWRAAKGGRTFSVINPATGQKLAEVSRAAKEDIRDAVEAAARAFRNVWGPMNPFERSRYMLKLAEAIENHAEFLAGVETDDVGKPIFESRNIDIASAAATMRYFAGLAVDIGGEVIPTPYNEIMDYTVREPLGAIGAIIPWNFPFLIAARKIGSALAAGDTVVVKPASWAPLSTLLFGELALAADLPPGVINIVPASGPDIGDVFSSSPELAEISFTGSTDIGTRLLGSCSASLKGCTLELGGKNPAIVLPDCDLDETIAGLLFGVFLNQGECCCGASRLIVHETLYDRFVDAFSAAAAKIPVGMPRDEKTRMGALVHPEHSRTVMEYVAAGKAEGARLVAGGKALKDGALAEGAFVAPTVFADVSPETRVWKEEIFGPVAVISEARDIEDLVAQANDTNYGLAASVWSTDLKQAHRLARQIEAGTVWHNLHNLGAGAF